MPIRKTEIREFGPGKRVLFQDGTSGEYDAVLLNTGYTKTCFDLYADMVATTSVSRRFWPTPAAFATCSGASTPRAWRTISAELSATITRETPPIMYEVVLLHN